MGESVGDLAEADGWPLDAPGRVLAEPLDQKLPPLVEKGVVNGRAAQIDADQLGLTGRSGGERRHQKRRNTCSSDCQAPSVSTEVCRLKVSEAL